MSKYPFSIEHLHDALERILDAADAATITAEAKRLAETHKVKLSDIREGDFVRISWYLPKREAYVGGVCQVVKVDDQGLHVEAYSEFGSLSFGDGETDLSLMKSIGPMNERRARNLVQEAWRVVPFEVEGRL